MDTKDKLEDISLMPIGKYKDILMQDVPVSYLHWICHNTDGPHSNRIKDYCKRSLSALKMEKPDLIWDIKTEEDLPRYEVDKSTETWWCSSHNRRATHILYRKGMKPIHVRDPALNGITACCICEMITGPVC